MNRKTVRIVCLLIIILITLGGTAGLFIWYRGISQHQKAKLEPKTFVFPLVTVYPQNAPPTPGDERITYTNTKYGYSFLYPSVWKVQAFTNQNNVDVVRGLYQVQAGVDGYPFDLSCMKNPNRLDAQTWFNQQGGGTGIGYTKLKSGETAYLDVEHGQAGINTYTLTHNHIVCQFSVVIANDANNMITNVLVNSFTWL